MFVTRCWWEEKRREGNYEVKNWHTRVGTDREGVGWCGDKVLVGREEKGGEL